MNKIREGLESTLWDTWSITTGRTTSLKTILSTLEAEYKIFPQDVFYEGKVLFMRQVYCGTKKIATLAQSLLDLIGEEIKEMPYVELTVTFTLSSDSKEILQNVPLVNVVFEKDWSVYYSINMYKSIMYFL